MTDRQWKKELNEIRQLWIESEKRSLERYEQIDRRLAATSKLLQAGAQNGSKKK